MEQLTLSFHEELLLKLKSTDWEFPSRPDSFEGISPNSKFIQLDRSSPNVGVQAEIVTTQRAIWRWERWPYAAATLVALLSGLPWAWYFLLRRIRELRDVIAGKRDV